MVARSRDSSISLVLEGTLVESLELGHLRLREPSEPEKEERCGGESSVITLISTRR